MHLFLQKQTILAIFILLYINILSIAQPDFHKPLNQPLNLSGTFGELRSGHLHSGVDFTTGGRSGLQVFAIDNGYVTRIQYNPYGFGRVIYISHPNGIMSVYAHLQEFNQQIEKYFRIQQYLQKNTELNIFPDKGLLTVKKGDIIGLSGNSGSSGGPHLHFEIRDDPTQKIKNPLSFIPVTDKQKPVIYKVILYPRDSMSSVNHSAGNFIITDFKNFKPIVFCGKLGIGIQTSDFTAANDNDKKGVYSIKVEVDSQVIFAIKFDTFSFDESKYANSLNDWGIMVKQKQKTYLCFKKPGNQLSIINSRQNGIIQFNDTLIHGVVVTVADFYGNKNSVRFNLKHENYSIVQPPANTGWFITYSKNNQIKTEEFTLEIPALALDDNYFFRYSLQAGNSKFLNPVYIIGDQTIALFKKCSLAIKVPQIDKSIHSKLILANLDDEKKIVANIGYFDSGYFKTTISAFGKYVLAVDTVPPVIKLLNPESDVLNKDDKWIQFSIEDKLSGIKSYNGYSGNTWLPFEYDPKTNSVSYFIDDSIGNDSVIKLKFIAIDKCDNQTVYEKNIRRK